KAVNASRGKHKRAEPVAALWEQGRMHFVTSCQKLEDELVTWTPDVTSWSPNRLDALVWGVTELGLIGGQGQAFMRFMRRNIEARDSEKPTLQEKKAQRQLARVIRLHPKYGRKADPPRYDRNCQHRWDRFGRCCFCGTFHVEETMKIRRGKGA
ncbi:MAG: hypothetical protein KGL39_44245, partial [Patescibacteria group bacterium]|nr:hypothetical protein [Patescibacteria group bacterium]